MQTVLTKSINKYSTALLDPGETRKQIRYRLAILLTEGKFAEALEEARSAFEKSAIWVQDFQFVQDIVQGAHQVKMPREVKSHTAF